LALDTYSGLQTSIAGFLNRSDLISIIPDFITLAESQMHRRFVGRQRQGLPIPRRMVGRSDATISTSDEYIAVPSDFAGPLSFTLDSDPITVLDYLDSQNLQEWKASTAAATTSGQPPRFYAVVGGEFQLYPIADQDYTGELTYIKRVAALTDTNTTNWVLADYPDAYLYGALVQSAPYLKDDGRLEVWGTLFTAALDDICNADPTPPEMSTLRTEFPMLTRLGRYAYDIQTDVP
jgi:hypothetical protein